MVRLYNHVLAQRLKKLRKEKYMTQKDIADMLSISRSVVGNWEAELRLPTAEQICQLAEFYEVTAEYLIGRSSEKHYVNVPKDEYFDINRLNALGKKVFYLMFEALANNEMFSSATETDDMKISSNR